MYAVIGGAGEVGYKISRNLYREGHNVAIIEDGESEASHAESLDALVISGNAASPRKLKEAGIDTADIYIAVTGRDEINILSCGAAKTKGVKTIARINNQDYIGEPITTKLARFGVDIGICPDLVTARKISRILTMPSLMDAEVFAGGRVQVVEARVKETSIMANKRLKELALPKHCNLLSIFRAGEVIIPHGGSKLQPDDRIVVATTDPRALILLSRMLNGKKGTTNQKSSIEKVMIVGATSIGINLARNLEKRCKTILIDEDEAVCREASERLASTIVINGNGTDEQLLVEEGIETVDAFVAATQHEDTNILSCLLGKEFGAKKAVALINRSGLKSMFEHIGIDVAIDPKMTTVAAILRHIYKSELLALSVLQGGDAKVMEMKINPKSKMIGRPIKKLNFPEGAVIAAVARGSDVMVPSGNDMLHPNDRLVVFAKTEAVPKVDALVTRTPMFAKKQV
jgi:trk system potassium uptake protein TrkA